MSDPGTRRNRLLMVIAVILSVAALRWSYPVTMPRVWGIVGAHLAVPLTAAIIIVCQHFKSTKRVATFSSARRVVVIWLLRSAGHSRVSMPLPRAHR